MKPDTAPNALPERFVEEDEIDLVDLLSALWRQKKIIILCTLLFTAIGWAYGFSSPRIYEAKTTLLILPPIPTEITGEAQVTPPAALFAPDIYRDLAVARDLLEEVVGTVYLDKSERPSVQSLAQMLEVSLNESSTPTARTPARQSQSFTLTVAIKGRVPERLPILLSAWSDAFIKRNSQLFVNRAAQSYDYIRETFATVKKDLETAEDIHLAYRKQNPTSLLEIQLETMKALHGEFLAQYTKNVRSLAPLEARAKAVREFLVAEPERVTLNRSMSRESLWNFLSQRLTSSELEHLGELQVIEELFNEQHQSLKTSLYYMEIQLADLKASIADLQRHIEHTEKEYHEKQTLLWQIQKETERLAREESVLKESHNALAKKFQASRIAVAEAADPIRVIENPVLPTMPAARRTTLILALSGFLGIFIGIFAALLVNMIQSRRTIAES